MTKNGVPLKKTTSNMPDTATSGNTRTSAKVELRDAYALSNEPHSEADTDEDVAAILDEQSEDEELLAKDGSTSRTLSQLKRHGLAPPKRDHGKSKRRSGRRGLGIEAESGRLMFEMEEGGPRSSVSSDSSIQSVDFAKAAFKRPTTSKHKKRAGLTFIAIAITGFFLLLTFGAYKASHQRTSSPQTLYNGTSTFGPTTILISLDGFRADFLTRGITPTLNQFIAEGVSPKYMLPSFPSLTFPNHYTLVTGMYPESHGIVGNTFWDPNENEEFWYTKPEKSMVPKWWAQAEPLWVTAEKAGVKTGIHMWPGSEAGMDFSATYLDKFNSTELLSKKTARIFELLDLPAASETASARTRPQLIAAYVPPVDQDGHTYGPNSTEIWDTIANVDKMLHNVFSGLRERNLTQIVNVVVVSDHGMATTSTDRLVQLDDLIDLDLVEHIDGWPLYGLRPKNPLDTQGLYDRLNVEAARSFGFDVYLRDQDMPARFHFSQNPRIAPLWVVPKAGWAIVHKEDFDVKKAKAAGETYHPKGLHGYDHEHPLMRAIFVARGPAFPHAGNSRVDNFQNTEVYNIVCDSLGIEPKPNNGTLRLPLKPTGLHSDLPEDPDADRPPEDFEPDPKTNKSGAGKVEGKVEDGPQDFFTYMKEKIQSALDWGRKTIQKLSGGGKVSKTGESDIS